MALWNKNEPEIKPEQTDPPKPEKSAAELIAESLKPLADGLTGLKDSIEARFTALEQSNKRPERTEPTEVPSVWDNEDAAFAARVGPVMMRQYELEARMVRQDIRREYEQQGFGDLWGQFEGEINGQLDRSALVQPDGRGGVVPLRGDPGYIRNVVNMVIGGAAVKAGMRFDGKKKTFFLETAGGDAGVGATGPEALEGLSPEQARLAQRMGVSLTDAKKAIKDAKFVN